MNNIDERADMSIGNERASDSFGAERIFHDEQEMFQHGRLPVKPGEQNE